MGRIKAVGLGSVVHSIATIIDAFHTSSILPGCAVGKTKMVEVTDQGADGDVTTCLVSLEPQIPVVRFDSSYEMTC